MYLLFFLHYISFQVFKRVKDWYCPLPKGTNDILRQRIICSISRKTGFAKVRSDVVNASTTEYTIKAPHKMTPPLKVKTFILNFCTPITKGVS